jgi:hypothetical protein
VPAKVRIPAQTNPGLFSPDHVTYRRNNRQNCGFNLLYDPYPSFAEVISEVLSQFKVKIRPSFAIYFRFMGGCAEIPWLKPRVRIG